jgi:hypothetical protein
MGTSLNFKLAAETCLAVADVRKAGIPADDVETAETDGEPRILLCLSGKKLSALSLYTAMPTIRMIRHDLDILVYSCGDVLPPLLDDFLHHLEREDITYRLICRHGPLAEEIANYIGGHRNPSLALVDSMHNWERSKTDPRPWRNLGCPVSALGAW